MIKQQSMEAVVIWILEKRRKGRRNRQKNIDKQINK
jgi:hypothetical protein